MNSLVHLVQLDCVWEDKAANFDRVRQLLFETPPAKDSLVVLPEMFSTGFSTDTQKTLQGPALEDESFLRKVALENGCYIVGGLIGRGISGKCQNQCAVFSPSGDLLTRYVKIQPFNLGGEGAAHEAGKEVTTFSWAGFRVAPFVCYDLRFPELARHETLQRGADVLIYIASWPIKRYQHWLTLLQARAIENLAYVIGVNRCGSDPHFGYAGRSVVVDPHGVIIADASGQEQVTTAALSLAQVQAWRRDFPALGDAQWHPPSA